MTLPTAGRLHISTDIWHRRLGSSKAAAVLAAALWCRQQIWTERWLLSTGERQTDGWTLHRPCTAYYAGNINKYHNKQQQQPQCSSELYWVLLTNSSYIGSNVPSLIS